MIALAILAAAVTALLVVAADLTTWRKDRREWRRASGKPTTQLRYTITWSFSNDPQRHCTAVAMNRQLDAQEAADYIGHMYLTTGHFVRVHELQAAVA